MYSLLEGKPSKSVPASSPDFRIAISSHSAAGAKSPTVSALALPLCSPTPFRGGDLNRGLSIIHVICGAGPFQ